MCRINLYQGCSNVYWMTGLTDKYLLFFFSFFFSSHNLQPLILTPSCSSVNEWGWGHLAHRFLTRRWPSNKDMVAAVLMLNHSWISRVETLRSSPVHVSTAWMFVTIRTDADLPYRGSSLKLRLSRLTSPVQKKEREDAILAKNELQILKGLLST